MTHLLLCLLPLLGGESIAEDEHVALMPGYAHQIAQSSNWQAVIEGVVYEPESGSLWRHYLYRQLRDRLELQPDAPAAARLQKRLQDILVDHESGKRVTVQISGQVETFGPTGDDGVFLGKVRIPHDTLPARVRDQARPWVPVAVVLPPGDERSLAGRVQFIPRRGVSIISDIDDTIRIAGIGDPRETLRRVFLEPFEPVDGMAAFYRHAARRGAVFHYVSNSPNQLLGPMTAFLERERFPSGSVHLRAVRWLDADRLVELFDQPDHKRATIGRLLRAFPARRFIMIGDARGDDPNVYASFARRHPEQVAAVWIRIAEDDAPDEAELDKAFSEIPAARWRTYRRPRELRAELDRILASFVRGS